MKNLELASFAFFYSTMFWQTHQRHISTDADDTKLSALPSLPTRAAVSRVHGNEGLMGVSLMLWLRFSWLVPPPMLSSWMRHAASSHQVYKIIPSFFPCLDRSVTRKLE
jgi:hypothetical protein